MLPDFLQQQLNHAKRTTNPFQRFHKYTHSTLELMRYATIIYHAAAHAAAYKTPKTDKMVLEFFTRPTEGAWLSFLELLISYKYPVGCPQPEVMRTRLSGNYLGSLQNLYCHETGEPQRNYKEASIHNFLELIVNIKNRLISHGLAPEPLCKELLENIEPLLVETTEGLQPILDIPLVQHNEELDSGKNSVTVIHGKADSSVAKKAIKTIESDGLFFILGESAVNAWPFLSCRDGHIGLFNRFDPPNHRAYYSGEREYYIRTSEGTTAELFDIDTGLLFAKPLNISVQVSTEGVFHNLPTRDYAQFVGRTNELAKLDKLMQHPRHFITALDGIGGVGKSAIAMEYCWRSISDPSKDRRLFDHIIWLSAKNTLFKNGRIEKLSQAFEHLDQLLDTILTVIGFPEYTPLETSKKERLVFDLLEATTGLIVIDNLETLKQQSLTDIWRFLDALPSPSKVLLTSREYHQNVPQTLRIESMTHEEAEIFVVEAGQHLRIPEELLKQSKHDISVLSSGLPLVIRSILAQISLGRSISSIRRGINAAADNVAKFCFEEQLKLLDEDQMTILVMLSLSDETLDHDKLNFMVSDLIKAPVLEIVNRLRDLSLVHILYGQNNTEYSILPLIRSYVLGSYRNEERLNVLRKHMNEYFELENVDSYRLLPVEERVLDRASLIPRKLVDKAMQHAAMGEYEQAEVEFKKAMQNYEKESYVWYMYASFLAQYQAKYSEAISALRKANDLKENYLYLKRIGDYHVRLHNFQAAVKSYAQAMTTATVDRNKDEMYYSIGNAEFCRVKQLRSTMRRTGDSSRFAERNASYQSVIDNLQKYLKLQPHINEGKLEKIFRILAEAYFALKDSTRALECIDNAIKLAEYDNTHLEFREIILQRR